MEEEKRADNNSKQYRNEGEGGKTKTLRTSKSFKIAVVAEKLNHRKS